MLNIACDAGICHEYAMNNGTWDIYEKRVKIYCQHFLFLPQYPLLLKLLLPTACSKTKLLCDVKVSERYNYGDIIL